MPYKNRKPAFLSSLATFLLFLENQALEKNKRSFIAEIDNYDI